ncbi:MAG: hypothetical protein WC174_06010 [Bacilli bacterium]
MKKKLVIFSLMLACSLAIGGIATSLAWYGASSTIVLSSMNISLTADPNLYIGIKEGENTEPTYYSNITNDMINDGTLLLEPVSSMYSSKWDTTLTDTSYPIYKSTYSGGKFINEASYRETEDAEGGYFVQELYLKSDKDVTLTFGSDSTFSPNESKNKETVATIKDQFPTLSEEQILTNLNSTYKSLRYSILIDNTFYIYDPFKSGDTSFGGLLDINDDYYYDYGTKDGVKKEILYGEYSGEENLKYGSNSVNVTTPDVFNANTKDGVSHIDLESSIASGLVINKENSLSSSDVSNKIDLITLKENVAKRFVFSVYIEGWDRDSTSLAMYGSFLGKFVFKVTQEVVV